MVFSIARSWPRVTVIGLNVVAVALMAASLAGDWATGSISTGSGTGANKNDVTLTVFALSADSLSSDLEWAEMFKFYDEGNNKCSDLFTSEGGVVGSTAATNVPVTISSCTDARADFDQIDTVGRLEYLALGFAAFGILCMLSVTVLSVQDTGADLWLAGVYTAFTNVLAFCLAISAVFVFATVTAAVTGDRDTEFVALVSIFSNPAQATSFPGTAFDNTVVELEDAAGVALAATAAALTGVTALLSLYELWTIKAENEEEEAAAEAAKEEEAAKKARLALKNEEAAAAQAQHLQELQAGVAGAAAPADAKKDQ